MYRVMMVFFTEDGDMKEYPYGTYEDKCQANEIALMVRDERGCSSYVVEVE